MTQKARAAVRVTADVRKGDLVLVDESRLTLRPATRDEDGWPSPWAFVEGQRLLFAVGITE